MHTRRVCRHVCRIPFLLSIFCTLNATYKFSNSVSVINHILCHLVEGVFEWIRIITRWGGRRRTKTHTRTERLPIQKVGNVVYSETFEKQFKKGGNVIKGSVPWGERSCSTMHCTGLLFLIFCSSMLRWTFFQPQFSLTPKMSNVRSEVNKKFSLEVLPSQTQVGKLLYNN